MAQFPRLSIVIAVMNGNHTIEPCLEALRPQLSNHEVIVVARSPGAMRADVAERYPDIRLLSAIESHGVPQLRARGIDAAAGEIIAILDAYCVVQPDWVRNLIAAHDERPEAAIGGSVELDRSKPTGWVAWATYFSEYADFVPPVRLGRVEILPGNNISYKRAVLNGAGEDGFWKTFTNRMLLDQGEGLWSTPAVGVRLRKPIPYIEFLRSRYQHGRCFAGMRVAHAARLTRLLRALTAPLLPLLFLWRGWAAVWSKRRYRMRYLWSVPLLFSFHCSWAWGELWGYLRGVGRSCNQLRF